jgi:hypothetical protein
MPIQSSGSVSLGNINQELGRNLTATIGLRLAEIGSYVAINTGSTSRPNGQAPHTMSEWRGYNHTASVGPTITNAITYGDGGGNNYVYSLSFSIPSSGPYYIQVHNITTDSYFGLYGFSGTTGTVNASTGVTCQNVSFRMRLFNYNTGQYLPFGPTYTLYVPPPLYGAYMGIAYCSGYTLYGYFANGSCGSYIDVAENNSPTCGYTGGGGGSCSGSHTGSACCSANGTGLWAFNGDCSDSSRVDLYFDSNACYYYGDGSCVSHTGEYNNGAYIYFMTNGCLSYFVGSC